MCRVYICTIHILTQMMCMGNTCVTIVNKILRSDTIKINQKPNIWALNGKVGNNEDIFDITNNFVRQWFILSFFCCCCGCCLLAFTLFHSYFREMFPHIIYNRIRRESAFFKRCSVRICTIRKVPFESSTWFISIRFLSEKQNKNEISL